MEFNRDLFGPDPDENIRLPQEETPRVDQPRWRSWAVWLSVLGAVWTILNAVGLTEKWGIQESTFKTVVDAIGVILIAFGILNDPTNKVHF